MALVLLAHYGAMQRGDRRLWLLIAAGLLFIVSLGGTVTEVADAERTTTASGSSFSPEALAKAHRNLRPNGESASPCP